jgi:hypothetical protein
MDKIGRFSRGSTNDGFLYERKRCAKPGIFEHFAGRKPCQTINVTLCHFAKSFFPAEATGYQKIIVK